MLTRTNPLYAAPPSEMVSFGGLKVGKKEKKEGKEGRKEIIV